MIKLQYPELFKKLEIINKELINFRIYDLKLDENDFYEYGFITLNFRHNDLKFKNSVASIDVFINDISENEVTYEIIKMVAKYKLKEGDNN